MASTEKKRSRRRNNTEKGFRPYHSVSVPKSMDLVHSSQEDRPKTTVMLRNIPNRYSQALLLEEIDQAGFGGSYDFFYLPMDTQNRTNVGYAFINFITSQDSERFMDEFANHPFKHHSSQKLARVSFAHVQGFIENLRHFSNRAVAHSRNSQYRPIVIHNGVRMDISDASALLFSVQASSSSDAPETAPQTACPRERQRSVLSPASVRPPEPPPGFSPETLGAVAEDSALRFSEAKKGFEEALSMLLSSYPGAAAPPQPCQPYLQPYPQQPYLPPPYPTYPQPSYPYQPLPMQHYPTCQRQESHEDDDRTQGGSAPVSPRRNSELFLGKSPFPADPHGPSDAHRQIELMQTPRTNRTLFIHGRFSA